MASRSNYRLFLAAFIACLTAALFGYSVGFIGGVLVLPSFLRHFHLDTLLPSDLAASQSRIVSVWLLGALFGVPLGMPVCSRLGRRSCLAFSAGLYVSGSALQLFDARGSLVVFELRRFLNGLGVGAGTLASPMYISEISPASERGMLMSGYQAALQTGALIGFWGAYASHSIFPSTSAFQWKTPVAIQLVSGALLLVGNLLIPETPRYFAERGQYNESIAALSWLRGLAATDLDFGYRNGRSMESYHREQIARRTEPWFSQGNYVIIQVAATINSVGLNGLNYFCAIVFISAGFTSVSSSLFLTGIFGVVKLVASIAFMFVFVRVKGNRFWLILGSSICGLSMLILAHFVHRLPPPGQGLDSGLTFGGVISILMIYIFAFSFGVSLGPISRNVCSEIFSLHLNAKCCAITTCTQWLFQIVIASITPHLLASVGWVTFLIYAIFCALTLTWVFFCVPETRGVAVGAAMDEVFGDKLALEEDSMNEDTEITPLLFQHDQRRRRSSVGSSAYL